MKKIVSLLLCIVIVLSFAACGTNPADSVPASGSDLPAVPEGDQTVAPVPDDSQPEDPAAGTSALGSALLEVFRSEAKSAAGVKGLAETLGAASDRADGPALMIEEISEGYLPGFSEDVSGFQHGAAFLPMIGSIPYAGYVFEAEDPVAFLETLKRIADPRWNICTEAKETVSEISENYVLFAMLPGD